MHFSIIIKQSDIITSVGIFVYMYIYMHTYIHACIHTHKYIYTHTHKYVCIYVYIHMIFVSGVFGGSGKRPSSDIDGCRVVSRSHEQYRLPE